MTNNASKMLSERKTNAAEHAEKTQIIAEIRRMRDEFERALPKNVDADTYVRNSITTVRKNKKLMEADPLSILGALMTAAQLGLQPGPLQHFHLIPFGKDEVQAKLILGYQGVMDLVYRSAKVIKIQPRIVYEKDFFQIEYGSDEKIVHKPFLGGDRGVATDYYASAQMSNGAAAFDWMSRKQVEAHRDEFRMNRRTDSPWTKNFDAMALKTVVLKLAKYLPKSVENIALDQATTVDGSVRTDISFESAPETTSVFVESEIDD